MKLIFFVIVSMSGFSKISASKIIFINIQKSILVNGTKNTHNGCSLFSDLKVQFHSLGLSFSGPVSEPGIEKTVWPSMQGEWVNIKTWNVMIIGTRVRVNKKDQLSEWRLSENDKNFWAIVRFVSTVHTNYFRKVIIKITWDLIRSVELTSARKSTLQIVPTCMLLCT